jgi:hypothetical protein
VNETYSDHEHSESLARAAQYFDEEDNGLKIELECAMKGENSGPRLCHCEAHSVNKKMHAFGGRGVPGNFKRLLSSL